LRNNILVRKKVLADFTCPGCNKEHTAKFDLDSLNLDNSKKESSGIKVEWLPEKKQEPIIEILQEPQQQYYYYSQPPPQQQSPLELSHDTMIENMPGGVNFAKCRSGNCGDVLRNEKFTTNFKTCPTCNSNTVPKNKKYCPTCGKNEPSSNDEDFWEESEIDMERLKNNV